jgi:hypothetical protein
MESCGVTTMATNRGIAPNTQILNGLWSGRPGSNRRRPAWEAVLRVCFCCPGIHGSICVQLLSVRTPVQIATDTCRGCTGEKGLKQDGGDRPRVAHHASQAVNQCVSATGCRAFLADLPRMESLNPESPLGLGRRRAIPVAQVRSAWQGPHTQQRLPLTRSASSASQCYILKTKCDSYSRFS